MDRRLDDVVRITDRDGDVRHCILKESSFYLDAAANPLRIPNATNATMSHIHHELLLSFSVEPEPDEVELAGAEAGGASYIPGN
jgi:hypothetical protein